MEMIMRNAIRSAGLLVAILVFTWSFISWSQSTDPLQPGYNQVIGSPLNQSSSGPAHSSAAVDSSVPGGVSSASLMGMSVTANAQSSGNSGSTSSGRASMSEFEAGSSQFNPGVWGAQEGWGRVSSVPGPSDSKSSTPARGSISTLRREIPGGTDSRTYKSAKILSTANTLYPLGGTDVSATARESALSAVTNEKGISSIAGGGRSATASGGNYSQNFPDSTKNAALISPPDSANNAVFKFDPNFGDRGFPDLADYQFLKPTLHVGGMKSGGHQEEDLYRRIERRIKEYREASSATAKSNGLEKNKLHRPSGVGKPLSTSSALRSVK
jgi:hypothetical protein